MCGRFTLRTPASVIAQQFRLPLVPDLEQRFNIAPSQPVAIVRDLADNPRQLVYCQWGLIPSWSKDASGSRHPINARCETVASSPMFRAAFRRRRCLIPTDGFYEWKPTGGKKQPFYIHRPDDRPFAFAGIWERWGDDGELETCAVLTTAANELMRPIHDRMPVIVSPRDYDLWLDPAVEDAGPLEKLFEPYPAGELEAYAVSTDVNKPTYDRPDCIQPIERQQDLF